MHHPSTRVSIHWVKLILQAAADKGIEQNAILKALDIDLDLENNRPSYLSYEQTKAIWSAAETLSNDPFFGLNMGEMVRPSYLHITSYVAMTSDTLYSAYSNITHYMPLISEAADIDIVHEGKFFWIRYLPTADKASFSRHQYEAVVSMMVFFTRWLLGERDLVPVAVHFEHSPGPDINAYQHHFGIAPKFSKPFTGVQFPREILRRPVVESDPGLNQLHKSHADKLLSIHKNSSWSARVIKVILDVGHFQLSREKVAEELNISTRTLQRRLQEEGTSFLDIIDAQRRYKAEEMICHSTKTLKEIALDLGFSEPSTFYRACHRWFDVTPNILRENARNSE